MKTWHIYQVRISLWFCQPRSFVEVCLYVSLMFGQWCHHPVLYMHLPFPRAQHKDGYRNIWGTHMAVGIAVGSYLWCSSSFTQVNKQGNTKQPLNQCSCAKPVPRGLFVMHNALHTAGCCSICCTILSYKLCSFSLLFSPFSGHNTWNIADLYITIELRCRLFLVSFLWKISRKAPWHCGK